MVWPLLVLLDGDWVLLEGDWLEVEDDGIELDDDGELLDVALVSLEVELDVLDGLPELPMLLDDEDGLALVLELDDGDALEAFEPDWPHLSIAAWVFGPRMPSIGPGLQPCAFSCCCCSRTDSSPLALALLPEPEVEELASVELEGIELALEELDGDCDEDCELAADCELFEALEDGWLVEDWDCAYAEPAASSAAMAMASFLEVISYSFPVGWGGGRSAGNGVPGPCAGPRGVRCKRCARVRRGFQGLARPPSFRTETGA